MDKKKLELLYRELWYNDTEYNKALGMHFETGAPITVQNKNGFMLKLRKGDWDQTQFERIMHLLEAEKNKLPENDDVHTALAIGSIVNDIISGILTNAPDMEGDEQDLAFRGEEALGSLLGDYR